MRTVLYFQSSLAPSNVTELDGFYRFAKAARWFVHVIPFGEAAVGRLHANEKLHRPDVRQLITFWNPSGAVVDCGAAMDVLSPEDFGDLPVVFLDHPPRRGSLTIHSDAQLIAETAAKELLAKGCESYGYVPWTEDLYWSRMRGEMFSAIVHHNGRSCQVFDGALRPVGGEDRLVSWLMSLPKPCGIFAANDFIGAKVLMCAKIAKVRVPGDLFVVGVDNDPQICEHASPTLTSIQPDFERAGFVAAEMLSKRVAHPRMRLEDGTFGPMLVAHRQSTNSYRRGDDRVRAAVDFIRLHACDGIKARDVVGEMGVSRRLAELRFREMTGRSILEEISAVRLEQAQNLLVRTSMPMVKIARKCGYGSYEALRKLIVRNFGKSPREYRAS